MIGRLQGVLLEKQPPFLLLDVSGVGYEVEAPMTTFYDLPEVGVEITLCTHLSVRDDGHFLYGFRDDQERRLFRELLKVNGVGARLALTILSGIEPPQLVACINAGDVQSLVRLPGIGKKTAERLVMELRDRTAAMHFSGTAAKAPSDGDRRVADAESALVALGYRLTDASRAIARVDEDGVPSEELIRRALRQMVG